MHVERKKEKKEKREKESFFRTDEKEREGEVERWMLTSFR